MIRTPGGPEGSEKEVGAAQFESDQVMQNDYRTQQATKPQTLSYAIMDSPVEIAAWISGKFNSWSNIEGNDIERVHSKDAMLTNIRTIWSPTFSILCSGYTMTGAKKSVTCVISQRQ